jgi:hypothetical protein
MTMEKSVAVSISGISAVQINAPITFITNTFRKFGKTVKKIYDLLGVID